MILAPAGCPSTLITRGRIVPTPDNAKRRKSLAAVKSRLGDNMKSMVSPIGALVIHDFLELSRCLRALMQAEVSQAAKVPRSDLVITEPAELARAFVQGTLKRWLRNLTGVH